MSPKVILIEKNDRYPLGKAEQFGEIVFISEAYINAFSPPEAIATIESRLTEIGFDKDRDYICMTGQALKIALLQTVAVIKYGVVQVLMWDATTSDYRIRNISSGSIVPEHVLD